MGIKAGGQGDVAPTAGGTGERSPVPPAIGSRLL